jgi:hypothetical protein
MPSEIRKTAEKYVKKQVETFSTHVAQKDVQQAIRKVAAALEEVRDARAEAQRCSINLK